MTVRTQSSNDTNTNKLLINHKNARWSSEDSDFALAELIVINSILDISEIECIEDYLADKYQYDLRPKTEILNQSLLFLELEWESKEYLIIENDKF